MDVTLVGLPAGLNAALTAAGFIRLKVLMPDGSRPAWLTNEGELLLRVVRIQNRNLRGEPMVLTLDVLAAPATI